MTVWTWDGSRVRRLDDEGNPSPGMGGLLVAAFWAGLAAVWGLIVVDVRRQRR